MAEFNLDLTPQTGKGKKKPAPLLVKFTVKDRPTVREQLAYWSIVGEMRGLGTTYERYWEAAKALVADWECALLPLDLDLDAADDPELVRVIRSVGVAVAGHMTQLKAIPKN